LLVCFFLPLYFSLNYIKCHRLSVPIRFFSLSPVRIGWPKSSTRRSPRRASLPSTPADRCSPVLQQFNASSAPAPGLLRRRKFPCASPWRLVSNAHKDPPPRPPLSMACFHQRPALFHQLTSHASIATSNKQCGKVRYEWRLMLVPSDRQNRVGDEDSIKN
jgi:hypothetical protein